MKKIVLLLLLAFVATPTNAQIKDYTLGSSGLGLASGGNYDYSDPSAVNIKVAVWGAVGAPGRYTVPYYTTVTDLFSLAGGPLDEADLDDLRLYRVFEDSTQVLLKLDYNDILNESYLEGRKRYLPDLLAGDILVVPGSPKYYFRDDFSFILSIFSTLATIAVLVFTLINK